MILRLSDDIGRAKAITSRYYKVEAECWPINRSALAFFGEIEEKKSSSGKSSTTIVSSPKIVFVPGCRGSLILSAHPSLSTSIAFITPDNVDNVGALSVRTSLSQEALLSLPYHFSVSILPHGHMN